MLPTRSKATVALPVRLGAFAMLALVIVLSCLACSRAPTEVEPEPEPEPEEAASPFAFEIKEAVLRRLLEQLDEKLGPGYLYVISDMEHGEELMHLLGDSAVPLTNQVVIAMEDGVVVAFETRQPVVMCALTINAWTADHAEVAGIWYASDKLEGEIPFFVEWRAPRWHVVDEEEEL